MARRPPISPYVVDQLNFGRAPMYRSVSFRSFRAASFLLGCDATRSDQSQTTTAEKDNKADANEPIKIASVVDGRSR